MVIFIGDKPSPIMKPGAKPFEGAACENRLKFWIKELGIVKYHIYNIDDHMLLEHFIALSVGTVPCVCLGNNAAKAADGAPFEYFKLPHPSGRNRQINNKAFISAKLEECKKYIKGFQTVSDK